MRFLGLFLFLQLSVFCQTQYPKDYFRSPMDIPLSAVGFFGELRPNHFHSGVDFRTEKREGIPIYATADGFISRIKVGIGGYGKALYIDHPNGFTTVYGHLQKFADPIQQLTNKEHYAKQEFEIDIKPEANVLSVKKGELIGYSGNTGSSSGPHLHFEFRDTKTEKIINPLLFGFGDDLKDSKAPQVTGMVAYPVTNNSQINGSAKPISLSLSLQKDGSYLSSKITASGSIGFSINSFDTSDSNFSKKGVYKIDAYLNGMPYFGGEFDTFSFDETKYINDYIDYYRYKTLKQRYQKLFVGKFFPQSIIKVMKNNGLIQVASNFTVNYKIVIQDFHQNKTTINIPISYGVLPVKQPKDEIKTSYYLKAHNENSYSKDGISVFFPEDTFYEDFYLKFDVKNNELYLHDDTKAVNEPFTITFDVSQIPVAEREKMFIGNIDEGRTYYISTFKKENTFSIKTKYLGKFALAKDTIAPKIYNPSFIDGANLDCDSIIKIHISDELSGIKEYNGYLNGKWILMEYENKSNRLVHNFSDNVFENGKNDFKLVVKDNMGNISTYETTFIKTK